MSEYLDPRVVLAGDWHGNDRWAVSAIHAVGHAGVTWILQLGDFGLHAGEQGAAYLDALQAACDEAGVWVAVTLGNHENYDLVAGLTYTDRGETAGMRLGAVAWVRDRIAILPRVHRWQVTTSSGTDRSFVSLGGAPSIDYPHRLRGVSWWPEEQVTGDHVAEVAAGGHADIMLAHDAPDGAAPAIRRIVSFPSGWTGAGLAYARQGRELMSAAFAAVLPQLYAHGHYHIADEATVAHTDVPGGTGDGVCRFVSMHLDGMSGNLALLDLDTLTVTWPTGHDIL